MYIAQVSESKETKSCLCQQQLNILLWLYTGCRIKTATFIFNSQWPNKNVFSDCLKRTHDKSGSLRYVGR